MHPLWLKKIKSVFRRKTPPQIHPRPTREEINALSVFDALRMDSVELVDSAAQAERALDRLSREPVVGFDTESRPTFTIGEVSAGPHVAQFAAPGRTYVFILEDEACRRTAIELIGSAKLKKVGFGLDEDRRLIRIRLKVRPQSLLDLETLFTQRGYGRHVGVRAGVAIVFKRRFVKSKRLSTSNWSRPQLSPDQLLYAANDAYAALRVYQALVSPI
jgi:ribonuclease D